VGFLRLAAHQAFQNPAMLSTLLEIGHNDIAAAVGGKILMKRSERLLLAAAVLLVVFGLFMIVGAAANIFDRTAKDSVPGMVALLLLLGVLPLVLGVWLFRHTQLGASRRAFEAREQLIVHLASQHQGVLTVPQVAEESGMTLEQAKEVLDHLYRKRFNELTLSDSGEMVYKFQV
jgi:hypothetical protein